MIAAISVLAQGLVSVSVPPTALYRLEPVLSEAFGRVVDVDPELESEVVVIHVRGVGARELREKLADAVCGRWEESAGLLVLRLDVEEQERWKDFVVARLARQVNAEIERVKAKTEPYDLERKLKELDQATRPRDAIDGPGPWRSLEALEALGAETIARGLLFEPAVYASNPTRFEKPLPAAAMQVVANFRSDWRALEGRLLPRGWSQRENRRIERVLGTYPVLTDAQDLRIAIQAEHQPYRRFDSGMYCGVGMSHGCFDMAWFSAKSSSIDGTALVDFESVMEQRRWKPTPLRPVAFDVILKQRQKWALERDAYQSDLIKVGPKGLKPIAKEPLADIYGDAFARWADAQGAQLCALVSDSWFDINRKDLVGTPLEDPREAFIQHPSLLEADAGEFLEWKKSGGWLTCRSWTPEWERAGRLNRRMAEEAVDRFESGKWPRFEEVIANPEWRYFTWHRPRSIMSVPAMGRVLGENRTSLFAQLSGETLAGFVDKKPRRFSDLPKADQELITRELVQESGFVHWSDSRMVITDPNGTRRPGPFPPEREMMASYRFGREDWEGATVEFVEQNDYPVWWGWYELELGRKGPVPAIETGTGASAKAILATGRERQFFIEINVSKDEQLRIEAFYREHDALINPAHLIESRECLNSRRGIDRGSRVHAALDDCFVGLNVGSTRASPLATIFRALGPGFR